MRHEIVKKSWEEVKKNTIQFKASNPHSWDMYDRKLNDDYDE